MMKKLKLLIAIGIFSIKSFSFIYTDKINESHDTTQNIWGSKIENLKKKLKDLRAYRISFTNQFKNYAKTKEDELEKRLKKLEDESEKHLKDLDTTLESDLKLAKKCFENQKTSLKNEFKNYVKKKEDKLQTNLKDISDKENEINKVIRMYREIISISLNLTEKIYHGYFIIKEENRELIQLFKRIKELQKYNCSSMKFFTNEIDEQIKKKQDKIDKIKKDIDYYNEKKMNMITNYNNEIDEKDLNIDSIAFKEVEFKEEIRQIMTISKL
jgi:hypothetical protein